MATTNHDNASQTLFRFVSLRNPQLTETKNRNLGFIQRPEDLESFFDSAVNPNDPAIVKFKGLERAAKSFTPTGFENEKQVEEGPFSEALKIGRKIAKKEELSPTEETLAKSLYTSLTDSQLQDLWDNLIFQTATQKDFYVKEAIIHILKALHFGYACTLQSTDELTQINGTDLKSKALEARVVLPMKFFGDGDSNSGSGSSVNNAFQVNVSRIGVGVINGSALPVSVQERLKAEGEKISNISGITLEKEALGNLKVELEKTQKAYYKARNKAYNTAYKAYNEENQEVINEYKTLLKKIKSQITENTTEEEIEALYAELEKINVPPFSFEYKNELNFGDLYSKLSSDSFKLFVNSFVQPVRGEKPQDGFDFSNISVISDRELQLGDITVEITNEYDTYSEIYEKLDEGIIANTQELFAKAPLEKQTYLNLGNVLVPVSNESKYAVQTFSRSYYLKPVFTPEYSRVPASISFYYQAESDSWGLSTATITAQTDLGSFEESFSDISVVNNKITFPPFLVDKFRKQISSLKLKIFFNNGQETNLDLSNLIINQSSTGILYVEKTTEEIDILSDNNEENFVTKHFGVKRLGIADYLKVEQSIHAYVPGEVSNIENVMASELRHKSSVARDYSETIDTTSESVETEKISDTSKAERNEMQTEVAKELEKQQSFTGYTNFSKSGVYKIDVGASYANNTAQHDSTRQAVTQSQEITERAMERVLTKINTERVQKIIKEFTETNVHEFDNRGKIGSDVKPAHITGVYRWVDKKMKNQIYNYGKRTMFEFMIPEPARLHHLSTIASSKETLIAPVDPRTATDPWTMETAKSATQLQIEYWAGIYNVKLTELTDATKSFSIGTQWIKLDGDNGYKHLTLDIPANYQASHIKMYYGFERNRGGESTLYTTNFNGGMTSFHTGNNSIDDSAEFTPQNVTGAYDFVYQGSNIDSVNFAFDITCKLSDAYMQAWIQENFEAIIKAYEEAYAAFQEKQKEAEESAAAEEAENKEKLGSFYREMESVILKHNCIAYLLQDYMIAIGKSFTTGDQMSNFQVTLGEELEQYTALAKFMEQAFEWEIMDYTFYPYYWADRKKWQELYLSQSTDLLFRNFLQAGMARVIVTVKPGFEDAVQFFMNTGKIWNGGEVPVIGDPMYMSIVDEMRQPTGEPQGKYWITRIPTTLTILQAESVGLEVEQPLPIFPEEHPENCENPKELETESSFNKKDIQLTASESPSTLS
ncbi:hypothetical protein [Chryseobacterium sp. CT-SW4]|uniref:hypothetical protein n=1 Tax=Chryseobacterium sp. SW-1 TaxID=3157343 RepID=UPI003B028D5A